MVAQPCPGVRGKGEAGQHRALVGADLARPALVGRGGRPGGRERGRIERLELDRIGAGRGGRVDEPTGRGAIPVVIHARLGDDEDPTGPEHGRAERDRPARPRRAGPRRRPGPAPRRHRRRCTRDPLADRDAAVHEPPRRGQPTGVDDIERPRQEGVRGAGAARLAKDIPGPDRAMPSAGCGSPRGHREPPSDASTTASTRSATSSNGEVGWSRTSVAVSRRGSPASRACSATSTDPASPLASPAGRWRTSAPHAAATAAIAGSSRAAHDPVRTAVGSDRPRARSGPARPTSGIPPTSRRFLPAMR